MDCNLCGGSQWQLVQGSLYRRCSCFDPVRLTHQRLEEMQLPAMLSRKGLDNYAPGNDAQEKAKDALVRISNYVEERGGVLSPFGAAILGPAGSGKTHLGAALLKRLRRMGFSCLFAVYHSFLEELRKEWRLSLDSPRSADPASSSTVMRMIEIDVLLLDDVVPLDFETPAFADIVPSIIRARHKQGKNMILTSRLPLEDPQGRGQPSLTLELGYSSVSRLHAMCAIVEL